MRRERVDPSVDSAEDVRAAAELRTVIKFEREELVATGVGLSLAAVMGVGFYGSLAQTTVLAVLCMVVAVVLARESARIDARLDAMPSASSFVTLIEGEQHANVEEFIRAYGRQTTRWLNVWVALYAAVGGIVPLLLTLTRDERPLPWALPGACAFVAVAAAAALISDQRRVLRDAAAFADGQRRLQSTAEQLTNPTTSRS